MAIHSIPLRTDLLHYQISVDLDGEIFGLELFFNSRDESWYLTLRNSEDEIIFAGRKIVVGFPLTARYRREGLCKGELLAVDTSGANEDPGETDLGARVQLLYIDQESLPDSLVA